MPLKYVFPTLVQNTEKSKDWYKNMFKQIHRVPGKTDLIIPVGQPVCPSAMSCITGSPLPLCYGPVFSAPVYAPMPLYVRLVCMCLCVYMCLFVCVFVFVLCLCVL